MRQQLISWWIPLIGLSILAYCIQTHLYLHKDVAIITHTAAAMLAGETYTKNIFEPNPPLIFYLSMPAIILAKFTTISILTAIRIYFIALILISLSLSYFLIKKLFEKNTLLIYLMLYVMSYVLFFLPAQQFVQREHFLLVFILPYLFASALFLEHKKLNSTFRMVIGLMAGIGFAIKPHFFTTFLLIEAYFIYRRKAIFGWIRTESVCIISVLLSYIAIIFLFYPQYLSDILPLWMPYYAALVHPFSIVLLQPGILYCLAVSILYFLMRDTNPYQTISTIFLLAMLGFICSYIFPRVAWYYHLLPALSMACVLATLFFWQITEKSAKKTADILLLITMGSVIYAIPLILSIHCFLAAKADFYADNSLSRLIQFFKKQPQGTTFDLFSVTHDSMILEFYTPAKYVGRFSYFVWEYNQVLLKYVPNAKNQAYEKKYIPFAMDIITHDLDVKKPTFVVVDIPSSLSYLGMKINYIEKYSRYKNFRNAWSHYRFFTRVGEYEIYILS